MQLDQNYLFSASEDKSVIIWNTFTKDQLFQIKLHKTFINLMLLCGKMLITGSVDGMIYFYDYPKKHVMTKFKNKDGKLFSMAYSNESRTLFLGSENENILKINYEDLLTLTGK